MTGLFPFLASFGKTASAFRRDERGSMATLAGITILTLMTGVGAAVDYSQSVNVRHGLAVALDAATLATARDLSFGHIDETEAKEHLQTYFDKAFVSTFAETVSSQSPLDVQIDTANGLVVAEAKTKMPTAFLTLAGVSEINVGVVSTASYVNDKIEIALVVDVTGSMNGKAGGKLSSTKIQELRKAVKDDFLANLFDSVNGPADDDRVRVSLVPYNSGVDLGNSAPKSYAKLSNKCMASTGRDKLTDDAPSKVLYGHGKNCRSNAGLIPMTNNPKSIIDRLNAIHPGGTTAGQVGLLWGWNTISPKWASEWSAEAKPAGYNDESVNKVIVFMTDGRLNASYERNGNTKANGVKLAKLKSNLNNNTGNKVSPQRALDLCERINSRDITVYTIAFALDNSKKGIEAKNLMRDCATDASEHFFEAGGGELGAAFKAIANDVRRIWLSS